jgi:O-antigen/teichoic acid export membrane protein
VDPVAGEPVEGARRPVGAGATLITSSSFVTAAAGGLMGVVVARLLGADGAGAFNVVISALFILTVFSTLGIEIGLSYFASGPRWHAGDALRQVQLAAVALGLAGAGVGMSIAALTGGSAFSGIPFWTAALGLAALPFVLSWTFGSYLALALDRYEAAAVPPAAQACVALVLVGALAPWLDLGGAVAAVAAAHVLVAAGTLAWGVRRLPPARPGWLSRATADLRRAAVFGVKSQLSSALQFVNQRIDLFFLNTVAAQATVGHYAIAVSVTTLGMLLPRALSSVVLPRVAALDASAAHAERGMVVSKSVRHGLILIVATTALLTGGLFAVPLVYGDEFEPAVGLGFILLPGIAALGVANVLSATVVGSGHPGYALRVAAIVTPVTIALYLGLIPPFEAEGAALASSVSYTATAILTWRYFRKITGLSPRELLPGREDLGDYRALARRVLARARS